MDRDELLEHGDLLARRGPGYTLRRPPCAEACAARRGPMLCLLGSPAVHVDGSLRPLRVRPKALALLVRLALDGIVTRAELARSLFAEADDPRATLRWHLSYLRKRLPEPIGRRLIATSETVQLQVATDVETFRAGVSRIVADPGSREAAEILALYRGDLGSELTVTASPDF